LLLLGEVGAGGSEADVGAFGCRLVLGEDDRSGDCLEVVVDVLVEAGSGVVAEVGVDLPSDGFGDAVGECFRACADSGDSYLLEFVAGGLVDEDAGRGGGEVVVADVVAEAGGGFF
jgi:hypothetical protein